MHCWSLLSRRQQSAKDRFLDFDVLQWFQLHIRAPFYAAGTVQVAAPWANKYGISDCFNELMSFADMFLVSRGTRVAQVLRRNEWISGEPWLSVLSTLVLCASQFFQQFWSAARGAGCGAWCLHRGSRSIALEKKPMATQSCVSCDGHAQVFAACSVCQKTWITQSKLVRLVWKRWYQWPRPKKSMTDDANASMLERRET